MAGGYGAASVQGHGITGVNESRKLEFNGSKGVVTMLLWITTFRKCLLLYHATIAPAASIQRVTSRAPYFLLDEVLPIGVPNAVKVTARIASTSASSASSCLGSFASASTHPCTVGIAALRTSAACSFISWGCFPATATLGQHTQYVRDRRRLSRTSCLCIGSNQALCGGGRRLLDLFDGGHCMRRDR